MSKLLPLLLVMTSLATAFGGAFAPVPTPETEALAAAFHQLQAVPLQVPPVAVEDEKRTLQIAALRELHDKAKKLDRSLAVQIQTELNRLGSPLPGELILQPKALRHPETQVTFYLESDGRHVSAVAPDGKILWHTDPMRDSAIGAYRVAQPVILSFEFPRDEKVPTKIWVGYNSSQFGELNLVTGKFTFHGQN